MDYAEAFIEQNRKFGDLIRDGDLSTPVTTCPGWNLRQLFRHVGRGDRWAAQIITDRAEQFVDPRTVPDGKPPADPDDAISWLHDGAQHLIDAVEQAGMETSVWTILGARPAYWWIRRRLHEHTVHCADAALALDLEFDVASELAADAISEWLELMAARSGQGDTALPLQQGQTMHLHATDSGLGAAGEWTVNAVDGRVIWAHNHDKGDVALRGAAADLLLAVTGRMPVADTDIAVFGDSAVWQQWLQGTSF